MQSTVCRGCRRPLLGESSGRNIFDDDSFIKSFDSDGSYNKKWCMKLYSGIELITGQKVSKEEKLPQKLCEICFQNVEAYINFRFQLIKSRDILLFAPDQDKVLDTKFNETENIILNNSGLKANETVQKVQEVSIFQNEYCNTSVESKIVTNSLVSKTLPEDLINVDDSSVSLDANGMQNEEGTPNDSLTCRLQNDQENNNLNDSDNSAGTIATDMEEIEIKQQDHDIESEIDVCSGEEDDVLELDVQKMKNETVEIGSSSESDIEVCDYEPTGKRGNFNTLSPPIPY